MASAIDVDEIELTSVGVDVGSSTSHLIFSKLLLKQDRNSSTRRFIIADRSVLYSSDIIDTPLINSSTIDIEELTKFIKNEYENAGIKPEDIQTGAVIVTGETAKKENASEIVSRISHDAGKFVAATAGPNFESMLAAMGSGMTARSEERSNTILSVDIGGGTSNMAISSCGDVISTACISVGGRLLAVENGVIWRIDEPTKIVMKHLGLNYKIGDRIPNEDILKIVDAYAEVLIEVISKPSTSNLSRKLMMTSDLDFSNHIDEISFSGGVGELIYADELQDFSDVGHLLAKTLKQKYNQLIAPVVEPENKIRATVIGAGAYSLSISGSTSYSDKSIEFPLRNIPVIQVDIDRSKLSEDHVLREIQKSFERFDHIEGEDVVALYFKDPVRAAYRRLKLFATSIEKALPNSINNQTPIILLFERDIGNSIGNVIRRETKIKDKLLAIDELHLKEGDWIDIGDPLVNNQVFPVTVKSLVFNSK